MEPFIDFDLSDLPSFAIGLFFNLLALQHLQVRDTVGYRGYSRARAARPLPSAPRHCRRPRRATPRRACHYRFPRPDPTGRTSWVTNGPTLCRRLATLIPPRRTHTVRYHGVFSSAHRLLDRVVPVMPNDDVDDAGTVETTATAAARPPTTTMLARRLDWAALLERVFGPDVTTCPRCGDALTVFTFITAPTSPNTFSITSACPPSF